MRHEHFAFPNSGWICRFERSNYSNKKGLDSERMCVAEGDGHNRLFLHLR